MKHLRARMTILIVMAVLASTIFLSFTSYRRARSSLISQLEDNYGVAAQKYALELTSWVNTNATIIDTMAAEIAVNDISLKGYDEFHKYLKNSNELLNKNGYVYDVYFTYPDNFMVCASDFMADGTVDFVHEREWYTTSALTGETFFAAPYLDSDTGKPVITISKAVYSDGELLGVLAADIFVDVLMDMISNADVEENSYAFMIDQHRRMLIHPNEEYAYDADPRGVMDVPGAPYGELMRAIDAGSDDMIFVNDYDGEKRGISYSKMSNTGWYVCIATSEKEISKDVRSLLSGFVITTAVSVLIGAVMVIFFARMWDRLNEQDQEYKQQVLRLEKQAADQASEAKSRFLADMSHEIRTPINTIIGMNEMILRETDSRDILGYARNIKQSGHNLLQLINGILDFSKIEDGKMEIVPARYSVSSQIAYFVSSVSERAGAKNLEVIFDIDPGLPSKLYGDDARINQVVMNLLTNAVKYTEKGSVTLSIKCVERNPEDRGSILIGYEVRDTGIGIKEDDMDRLFESFERLDVVRNRNIEGTGLGMTITRKLLELMGSELKVESKYGEGSSFSFELWQRIENDRPLGDYKKAIRESKTGDTYRESFHAPDARILVVDDMKMNVFVVENLLKKTGIGIDSALSGPESIELAARNKYDVILMDQRMPGMDGTEAMKRIRELENEKNKKTPIICLTADVIMGARDRYIEMGFDNYLTKPVDGTELERMLMHYIPGEKIETVRIVEEETSDDELYGDELLAALVRTGVDIKSGLAFCGNDVSMYKSVLGAFVTEAGIKIPNLTQSFEAGDWKNYTIYIHSLKGAARTVGATGLSGLSAMIEAAGKEGDAETIKKNHNKVMAMYEQLVDVIRNNSDADTSDEMGDDEIIEFEPE